MGYYLVTGADDCCGAQHWEETGTFNGKPKYSRIFTGGESGGNYDLIFHDIQGAWVIAAMTSYYPPRYKWMGANGDTPAEGAYDNFGSGSTPTVTVSYDAGVPVNAAPSCSVTLNSTVQRTVTVTPTASDSDGSIASLVITWGDGETTTGCTGGTAYAHTYAAGGQKTIYATATDNEGAATQSSSVTATVLPWTLALYQKTGPTVPTYSSATAHVDGKIYSVCGVTTVRVATTWEYNIAADTWTQKADYGGAAQNYLVAFAAGGKAYAGMGYTGASIDMRWFEYDPAGNAWSQKTTPSFGPRIHASTFEYDGHGYVGGGLLDGGTSYSDLWRYNHENDTWTQLASANTQFDSSASFVLGTKGYIVMGKKASGWYNYVRAYDFVANTWASKNAFPDTRDHAVGFVDGADAYVLGGYLNGNTPDNKIYKYNSTNDSWALDSTYYSNARLVMAAQVGSEAYIFGGFGDPGILARLYTTTEPNAAPSCSITLDSVVSGLVTVTPTASDSDGTIASLVITWGDGETTTGCTSGQAYQHTYGTNGEKSIYATATDDDGASTQSNTVTPTISLNAPPSCDIAFVSKTARTVTVSVTGTDSDGTLASGDIDWGDNLSDNYLPGQLTTLQGGGTLTLSHTYVHGGVTYDIGTSLTDDDGASATDTVSVAVAANAAPTCSITQGDITNRAVSIVVTAGDTDGTLASVTINWGGDEDPTSISDAEDLAALVGGVTYTHTYPSTGGTFGVTASALDNEGSSTTSGALSVVVSPNSSPVCAFTVEASGLTVTINANSSSDPDGTIVSWRYQPDTLAAWIDGALGQASVHEYFNDGEVTITVEVTDDEGGTDTATTTIVLSDNNVAANVTMRPTGIFIGMGM